MAALVHCWHGLILQVSLHQGTTPIVGTAKQRPGPALANPAWWGR